MIKFLEVNFANHKNILVGTYKENKKAILFYKNNGFKRFKSYEVYHCYEKNSLFSDNKTFIIAEIGNNHEGSYTLAKKMIVEAWKTGVDAIKLQHIVPEKFFINKEQIKKYKKFQFKDFEIRNLIRFAKEKKFCCFGLSI